MTHVDDKRGPMSEVLIVDDEQPMRELLSRWLAPEGYALCEAADADRALAVMSERQVGVVLCDRAMPGRDGIWLVEQIREHHPSVAIILATADDSLPPRVSLRDGVIGYLVKPFKQPLVLDAVRDAMAWHRVAVTRPRREPSQDDPIDPWLRGRAGRPDVKPEP